VQSIGAATEAREGSKAGSGNEAAETRRPTAQRLSEQRPPRVVHVAQTIAGGIASFFEEIAPYQNDAFGKGNVTFVVPEGSEVHLPTIDRSQIVTFAATSRGPAALLSFGRAATKAVRQLAPDIVHLHSSFAGAVLRLSFGARKGKPRVIYCPHGWAFAMEISSTRKRIYAAVERWLTRRTDLVIANSETERQAAIAFGLPAEKIRTVKNGIQWTDTPQARPPAAAPRRLQLAFIGRLDRQKGIDILLGAIERFSLQHIDFHIVGDSVLARSSSEQSTAGPNVIFHGWLSRADTMKLLGDVDGLVMPSRWDAAPIVAIEAMRAGVPVIGSDRGALPEIIRDGVGGLIFELDQPNSLGELLKRIDLDELRRLGVTARARWEADYSSDRMNELTVEAYFDVLSQAPSSSSVTYPSPRGIAVEAMNGRAA
jgi:glycosyltransferase involved in cell wall biosynthesis